MITQTSRNKDKIEGSIYNYAVDAFINTQSFLGYKLKVAKNEILNDYVSHPKLLLTSIVPLYDSPIEEEVITLAMDYGWKFKCCGRSFTEVEQFQCNKKNTKWYMNWTWDTVWPIQIKNIIAINKEQGATTAFIGYRMDEVTDMVVADYSGTCIDAMSYTKDFCTFVSDRAFNNFAFSELLLEIIKKDIYDFLDNNKKKYFEKIS